ncbi:hypothetical protein BC834DRAFT_861096 [Gloeopeniophorella convolvens]|nr:hypothetical protein BC834DRAFT_861096 [Gloeopeniophorella convolvens]
MVVVDEKAQAMLPPPPPYSSPSPAVRPSFVPLPVPVHPPPFSAPRARPSLATFPPHLLLHIVHRTFPQAPDKDYGKLERQRKTLYWLSTSLRLVNRAFYIACMHVLRSTYLPSYTSLIRSPYTSDPFPLTSDAPVDTCTPSARSRETAVLDLFIALKVRDDVWADDTELHLGQPEAFRDLFDLSQPRARLEDLLRARLDGDLRGYSVTFAPRRVGVIGPSRRTVAEVERTRDEALEVAAKRLARRLREYLAAKG